MFTEADNKHMQRALALAKRGLGKVEPNPMVGAVIVKHDKVVGEGYHHAFGKPHAEVDAISQVKNKSALNGSTAYVTLEPCCHTGKTPPCTGALIDAKVARVVVAMRDPFAKVAGKGLRQLRNAGVQVDVGLCEAESRELNHAYIKRVESGLPWVIAKWAQTLDGRIATSMGDSQWISSAASRKWVHQLRARVDGVMVGIGTALADDPQLTARDVTIKRNAAAIVIDPNLRLPVTSKLVKQVKAGERPVFVATTSKAPKSNQAKLQDAGVTIITLPTNKAGKLQLRPLLKKLAADHQMTNILVEGGAGLLGNLLGQSLLDEAFAFVCPKLLGDVAALPIARGMTVKQMKQATQLSLLSTKRIGDDVLLRYRF